MSRLDVMIASRYLRSRRSVRLASLITMIAIGGVTVGVGALIVVTGVMNGLVNDLQEKILVATPHLRVGTYGKGIRLDNWEFAREEVLKHPDVLAAAPFVLTQGLLTAGADYSEGAYVVGIDPDTGSMAITDLPRRFMEADLSFETTRDDVDGGIVLGRRLGERFVAYKGDTITVISPVGARYSASTGIFQPRFWVFEVTGHFETGMYEYDNAYAVTSLKTAQEFAQLGDAVSMLEVRLKDGWEAARVGREIEEQMGYPYRTVDWQSQNAGMFQALKLEKLAMGLVLLLIVVVAAFNIVSTLIMVVRDKTREIGILRAMGMPAATIRRAFILQGVVIGVVGTTLGTILGLVLARYVDQKKLIDIDPTVYFIDHLPVQVSPIDLALIVVASIIVATLATIYPASRAASLHPVEAIRYE
ncbi:MAG: ABC transporter permease [Gemmatimonadota bacterium]|nr:MAG: ABC transporter permease [Gemmatimonadota bacterium]